MSLSNPSCKVLSFPRYKRRSTRVVPWSSSGSTISMFESRTAALVRLQRDMQSDPHISEFVWIRSVRLFRMRFCAIVRRHSGMSKEALCDHLNAHSRILKLKTLPGARDFFPITPDFISKLENGGAGIIEYNPYCGGFLGIGSFGVPTEEIAVTIAEICGALAQYRRFEDWCADYLTRKVVSK